LQLHLAQLKKMTAMEFVHLDSEAFKNLKKQLDRIEREIRKLRDPVQVVSSEWLTIDEAAQVLRVTKRTVFKYIKNGELHRFDIVSSLHRQSSSRLLALFCANLSNRVQIWATCHRSALVSPNVASVL
jgi:predicted GTPase